MTAIRTLFLAGSLASGLLAQDPAWKAVARMDTERTGHCAVGLREGRVLIAGGRNDSGVLRSTEIYGPEEKFAPGPPMNEFRSGHSCILLDDGRLLVTGGSAVSGAEVWDPENGKWSVASGDPFPNTGHTATKLNDGRVLLAGGMVDQAARNTLALYDPAANEIRTLDATLMEGRSLHISGTLADGRVLLAGGESNAQALRSAEIFDPVTETIWPASPMALGRSRAGAAVLPNGRFLAIAGTDYRNDHGNGELYLDSEDRWEWVAAPMAAGRRSPFAATLPSGQVLIAGGAQGERPIGDTELFDPSSMTFYSIGELTAPRSSIAGALIPGTVSVLATGGTGLTGPSPLCGVVTAVSAGLVTRNATGVASDFDVNETVTVNGSGFAVGVTVALTLTNTAGVNLNSRLLTTSVVPTAAQTFSVPAFRVALSDIGQTFTLTASQGAKGSTVTTKFNARVRLTVTGGPTATSSIAGTNIQFLYTFGVTSNAGPITGNVTLSAGTLSRTVTPISQSPGIGNAHSICCITTPGTVSATVRFNGDAKYQPFTTAAVSHTVNPFVLLIATSLRSLALFEEASVPISVLLPVGTPSGQPAPTGSLTLSGSGIGPLTLNLTVSPRGDSSSTNFRFRPTFASRPSACFSGRYSGDARYAPQDYGFCLSVGPARTTLQVTPSPADYSFGSLLPLSVRLTFPPEIGIVTRQIALTATPRSGGELVDGSANTIAFEELIGGVPLTTIGTGQASVDLTTAVRFNQTTITVKYPGGGDLQSATLDVPLRMRQLTTQIVLRPVTSPSLQPLTLNAILSGCPFGADCARIPSPSGVVRFFDGELQIAEVPVTPGIAGAGTATLSNVTRPPGTRQFRAVYVGDTFFTTATSPTLSVVVQ